MQYLSFSRQVKSQGLKCYLTLELLERILNAENGLEDRTLQDWDQGVQVGVHLAVAAEVVRLANFELKQDKNILFYILRNNWVVTK